MLTYVLAIISQVDPASLPTDIEPGEAFASLVKLLGGLKGASALAIAAAAVQALMLFFRTQKFAGWSGKWRLTVVTGLSVIAGVLASRLSGVDWLSSLVNGTTLAGMSVFGNQIFQQFKPDPGAK